MSGGIFTGAGWQVTDRGNFIRYRVQPMSSCFVEWENLNLTPFNPRRDLFTIMGMWDPSRGDYRENPFRVHVRKLDTQGHNAPYGNVPAAVEFGRVAVAPVNTPRQQPHRCQEISVCF